jgi:hypothetical protein
VPGSFDVAVSRAGVMFFGDPVAAFANVAGALRAGGRLAVLVWQPLEANEWMVSLLRTVNGGLPPPQREGPFSLADPDRVRSVLGAAGFTGVTVTGLREPIWFGPDADRAYRYFAGLGPVRAALAGSDPGVEARLRALLAAHTGAGGVHFGSAMWLVTARR